VSVNDDPDHREFRRCALAIPCALLIATLLSLATQQLAMRLFGAHVHELGHWAASVFTGHPAMPSIGITYTFERDTVTPVGLAAMLGFVLYQTLRRRFWDLSAALVVMLVLQAIGTLTLDERSSWALIVWGGDGIGMVLATMLMASFLYAGDAWPSWLRWLLLVIGAGTFADIFVLWLRASHHLGMPVGSDEADFVRLVRDYGWTQTMMVQRYVATGFFCLMTLAPIYLWQVHKAWKAYTE